MCPAKNMETTPLGGNLTLQELSGECYIIYVYIQVSNGIYIYMIDVYTIYVNTVKHTRVKNLFICEVENGATTVDVPVVSE